MADRHRTGRDGEPVPRDLPDQQVSDGEDPLDVPLPAAEEDEPGSGLPDTDEAGSGRQGERRSTNVHPEHPEPDESPA